MMEASTDRVRELVGRLNHLDDGLPEDLEREILSLGSAAVPGLIEVVEASARAEDPPSQGAFSAAWLLAELEASDAVRPLFRLLAHTQLHGVAIDDLIEALCCFGVNAVEPGLEAYAAAADEELRAGVCDILAAVGVSDDRIFAALCRELETNGDHGAMLLARYGDRRALPLLSAEFERRPIDGKNPYRNHVFIELKAAIEELGGELSPAQREKLNEARERSRQPDELDNDESPHEADIEAELLAFEVARPDVDSSWVDMMFRYAADYEDVGPDRFDHHVLEAVLFEWFPEKLSCDPEGAPAIVESLRAYWAFARDQLHRPDAANCLQALGGDAVDRLRRGLADTEKFGMAKAFVLEGRAAGFDVDSEEGLAEWVAASNALRERPAGTSRAEKAKKKKERKQKKKARRKNRR